MRLYFSIFAQMLALWTWSILAMANCKSLLHQKFSTTQLGTAEVVSKGTFAGSDWSGKPTNYQALPEFCRVVGAIMPTKDSRIGFELWLPERWNGRYLQVGNGGFGGTIVYQALAEGLRRGFAVASTDDGHSLTSAGWTSAAWALGHPQKMIDFEYRAVHLTDVVARTIVETYYNRTPSFSYFDGCSEGGRESLVEAQRYPQDFDGFVAGAPGNDWTSLFTYFLHMEQTVGRLEEPLKLSQLDAVTKAALARCDAQDGVRDGVISRPFQCDFNPATLLCKGPKGDSCLTARQVEALRELYEGAGEGKGGLSVSIAPGSKGSVGTEAGQWPGWVTGGGPNTPAGDTPLSELSDSFFRYMVYQKPELNVRALDLVTASTDARSRVGPLLNAVDPNLSDVRAAGKKMIQYHGLSDAVVPAQYSISYYQSVAKYMGGDVQDFYRMFLVPGMEHCGGGPGADKLNDVLDPDGRFDPQHDVLAALMQWVEEGRAPQQIVVTKFRDDDPEKPVASTQLSCPFPVTAHWTGKGSAAEAKNFICAGN